MCSLDYPWVIALRSDPTSALPVKWIWSAAEDMSGPTDEDDSDSSAIKDRFMPLRRCTPPRACGDEACHSGSHAQMTEQKLRADRSALLAEP